MITCFGGGKGLSSTLKALKLKNLDFSAVVSTTDNGGSTGILRKKFKIPAIGDFRRVIDTISNRALAATMESRYEGHALGNLAILDLINKFGFVEGFDKYRESMGVTQRIIPQFTELCDLVATIDGKRVFGEVQLDDSKGRVQKMWIEPEVKTNPEVLELLASCDSVIIGPGSIYTSILSHLVCDEVVRAINKVPTKVFIMGIENDYPIVEGFKASDYLREIERFVKPDYIISQSPEHNVPLDVTDKRIVAVDVAESDCMHNPKKLGEELWKILR
ncbi:MAG: hypothetical protein GOV01_00270 [Candidatus Altiarchaeota archaeon]|nr:hypothetical protein [Candidatus Altiarchaeota archaeon]